MSAFDEAVKVWSGAVLRRREELCVNLRARSVKCTACADACPAAALDLSEDSVAILDACTSCGACVPACPGGVFSITGYGAAAVVDAVKDQADVRLHCSESRGIGGGGVVVPCLHVVDARLIAAMAAEGAKTVSFGGLDRCEACSKGDAREAVSKACARVERWLGGNAPALNDHIPADDGARATGAVERHDQVKMDRRSFLRFAGVRAAVGAVGWVSPRAEQREQSVSIFDRDPFAPQPVEYQEIVSARADALAWADKARPPLYTRTFEQACTVCEVCAQRCPTGALELEQQENGKAISYDPDLCTNCTLCAVVCPYDAVKARAFTVEDLAQRRRTELVRQETVACKQCGRPFVPALEGADGLCQTCRIEDELDEEWMDMMRG